MSDIKAILFDVIGTTVQEKIPDVVNSCFDRAFRSFDLDVEDRTFKTNRGFEKRMAIKNILNSRGVKHVPAESVYRAFKTILLSNLHQFHEHPSLNEVIETLRKRQIKIGVGTGLSGDVFRMLYDQLNWQRYRFDFIGVCDDPRYGRPHPHMIQTMMAELSIHASKLLKIGDTVADIREGKNAGVVTAVVLAGTQPDQLLRAEKPDFVLQSLVEVLSIS